MWGRRARLGKASEYQMTVSGGQDFQDANFPVCSPVLNPTGSSSKPRSASMPGASSGRKLRRFVARGGTSRPVPAPGGARRPPAPLLLPGGGIASLLSCMRGGALGDGGVTKWSTGLHVDQGGQGPVVFDPTAVRRGRGAGVLGRTDRASEASIVRAHGDRTAAGERARWGWRSRHTGTCSLSRRLRRRAKRQGLGSSSCQARVGVLAFWRAVCACLCCGG